MITLTEIEDETVVMDHSTFIDLVFSMNYVVYRLSPL